MDKTFTGLGNLPEILNVKDLSKLLELSTITIKKYILDEKIPAHRFSKGKYLISTKELIDFIEKRGLKRGLRT